MSLHLITKYSDVCIHRTKVVKSAIICWSFLSRQRSASFRAQLSEMVDDVDRNRMRLGLFDLSFMVSDADVFVTCLLVLTTPISSRPALICISFILHTHLQSLMASDDVVSTACCWCPCLRCDDARDVVSTPICVIDSLMTSAVPVTCMTRLWRGFFLCHQVKCHWAVMTFCWVRNGRWLDLLNLVASWCCL